MIPLLELGGREWEGVGDIGLGLGLGFGEGPEVVGDGKGKSTSFGAAYRTWRENDSKARNRN
jgi:hypothetical protein